MTRIHLISCLPQSGFVLIAVVVSHPIVRNVTNLDRSRKQEQRMRDGDVSTQVSQDAQESGRGEESLLARYSSF